jgi:hypothetical protein
MRGQRWIYKLLWYLCCDLAGGRYWKSLSAFIRV